MLREKLFILYIYIYIYMCVCVCVSTDRKWAETSE